MYRLKWDSAGFLPVGGYFKCTGNDYFQQNGRLLNVFTLNYTIFKVIYLLLSTVIIWLYFVLFCFKFSSSSHATCWSVPHPTPRQSQICADN